MTTKEEKNGKNANGVKLVKPFIKKENPQAEQAEQAEQVEQPQAATEQVTPKALTFEEMQTLLNAELERLNKKNELTKRRNIFVHTLEDLKQYAEKLENDADFETKVGRISFQSFESEADYKRGAYVDRFSITSTAIILKFIQMLSDEITAKIAELETEIVKP